MTTYPTVTLWQPWATLAVEGAKPFEFRSWPAPRKLRGKRIGIHAGARQVNRNELRDLILRLHSSSWRDTGLRREQALRILEPALISPGLLPRSAVVGLATLGEPIRDKELADQLGLPHVNDSDRGEHTNWGWPLIDPEPLLPYVPAKGAQGFWGWIQAAP